MIRKFATLISALFFLTANYDLKAEEATSNFPSGIEADFVNQLQYELLAGLEGSALTVERGVLELSPSAMPSNASVLAENVEFKLKLVRSKGKEYLVDEGRDRLLDLTWWLRGMKIISSTWMRPKGPDFPMVFLDFQDSSNLNPWTDRLCMQINLNDGQVLMTRLDANFSKFKDLKNNGSMQVVREIGVPYFEDDTWEAVLEWDGQAWKVKNEEYLEYHRENVLPKWKKIQAEVSGSTDALMRDRDMKLKIASVLAGWSSGSVAWIRTQDPSLGPPDLAADRVKNWLDKMAFDGSSTPFAGSLFRDPPELPLLLSRTIYLDSEGEPAVVDGKVNQKWIQGRKEKFIPEFKAAETKKSFLNSKANLFDAAGQVSKGSNYLEESEDERESNGLPRDLKAAKAAMRRTHRILKEAGFGNPPPEKIDFDSGERPPFIREKSGDDAVFFYYSGSLFFLEKSHPNQALNLREFDPAITNSGFGFAAEKLNEKETLIYDYFVMGHSVCVGEEELKIRVVNWETKSIRLAVLGGRFKDLDGDGISELICHEPGCPSGVTWDEFLKREGLNWRNATSSHVKFLRKKIKDEYEFVAGQSNGWWPHRSPFGISRQRAIARAFSEYLEICCE